MDGQRCIVMPLSNFRKNALDNDNVNNNDKDNNGNDSDKA